MFEPFGNMVAQVPGLPFSEVYFKNVCSK